MTNSNSAQNRSANIQSGVAILVALLALFISIWQGCEERKHNRLSVTPILSFDGITSNNFKSIRLSNDGLGPALIQNFTIEENGKLYNAADGNPWSYLMAIDKIEISEMYYFDNGTSIKPDEAYNLLTWKIDSIM